MDILINPQQQFQRPLEKFSSHKLITKPCKTIFVQPLNDYNNKNNINLINDEKKDFNNSKNGKIFESICPSFYIPTKLSPNELLNFDSPETNTNDDIKKKSIRRLNYGKGPEIERLKKFQHYKEPFTKCSVYLALGKPTKEFIINLGDEYNKHFEIYISTGRLPKFRRDHRRNFGLAVWFFEDIFTFIYPWLKKRNLIHE